MFIDYVVKLTGAYTSPLRSHIGSYVWTCPAQYQLASTLQSSNPNETSSHVDCFGTVLWRCERQKPDTSNAIFHWSTTRIVSSWVTEIKEVKKNNVCLLLCICSFSAVARRMEEIAPLVLVQGDIHNTNGYRRKFNVNVAQEQDMIPLLSLAQEEQLDTCINKFNEAFESNQIQNVTTSAVMELYEYKVRHAIW